MVRSVVSVHSCKEVKEVVVSSIQIRGADDDGITVVSFSDEKILEAVKIKEIGAQLKKLFEDKTLTKLIVDCSGVTFMSSAMIGHVVLLHKVLKIYKNIESAKQ